MRYGTGCCTACIPGQVLVVLLWCRTRVPADRLSLHTHAGLGLGSRRTRVATCLHVADPGLFMRACRRARGSHPHPAGSLGHADYGPALSWLRLSLGPSNGAACVRLVLFQLRVRSATGRAAARRRAVADLRVSKRTRRAATVPRRCRHIHPGAVLTRRGRRRCRRELEF
jgi:hypothetical protein